MIHKKILVAGDSWGLGECLPPHLAGQNTPGIAHGGLAQYLEQDGHQVWNISDAGLSNLAISERISNWLAKFHDRNIDCVIMFATEYTRDMNYEFPLEWTEIKHANDLCGICLSRSYYKLRDLSAQYHVPIYLVGGVVDTMYGDRWPEIYPGVNITCQSMVNLILKGNHRTDNPVYSWYGVTAEKTVQRLKQHLPLDQVEVLLDLIDQGFRRQSLVYENPEFFWPDGVHANRKGHKVLYDFLQQQGLFN
jgi:hypothetical protein